MGIASFCEFFACVMAFFQYLSEVEGDCLFTSFTQALENAGLNISNPIIAAKADAILQSAQELFAPLNPTVNFAVGSDFEKKRDAMMPFLMSRFDDLSRALMSSDGRFFIDDNPRACDFAAFHHLDLSKKLDPLLIKKFPRLENFVDEISSVKSVNSYLLSRPELIGVGTEPKLKINHYPINSGVLDLIQNTYHRLKKIKHKLINN